MTRFPCRCPAPSRYPSPFHRDSCVTCSGEIREEWTSNDRTVKNFYDALERGVVQRAVVATEGPHTGKAVQPEAPEWFRAFRQRCEARERAGRDTFGLRCLGRDNLLDAHEEWADGSNYVLFDSLKEIRRSGHDPDLDAALMVAYHAAMAAKHTERLRSKRRGAP